MSGVLFIVTVPKPEYEEKIKSSLKQDEDQTWKDPNYSNKLDNGDIQNIINDEAHYSYKNDNKRLSKKNSEDEYFEEQTTEKVLKDILKALNITDSFWGETIDATHWQVSFTVSGRIRSERVLRALRGSGLGTRILTALSVVPCTLHYRPITTISSLQTIQSQDMDIPNHQSAWTAFVNSVSARQTIAQLIEQIRRSAALTFDFIFLLMVAAFIAALGLVENSTVFLVASMLISPLMGPIMASTFGTAIRDYDLLKMGMMHEFLGLFLASIAGFLFGMIICCIGDSYGTGDWPTFEITSRCDLRSLWVGALIAIPSGAAAAIAVVSDNSTSLVGVAISASLLPPAVNAGLLWAIAIIHVIFKDDDTKFTTVVKTSIYSDDPATELAIDGFLSLCLTLVNIFCIYIAGILVYMIKEVVPANVNDEKFWKHDIKIMRDFNKTNNEDVKSQAEEEHAENFAEEHEINGERRIFVENRHLTWSPYLTIPRISAKEFHGIYERENKTFRKQRLSFPINRIPGYTRLSEECGSSTQCSTNHDSLETFVTAEKKSKFTVIPVNEF